MSNTLYDEFSFLLALKLGEVHTFDNSDERNIAPTSRKKYKRINNGVRTVNERYNKNQLICRAHGNVVKVQRVRMGSAAELPQSEYLARAVQHRHFTPRRKAVDVLAYIDEKLEATAAPTPDLRSMVDEAVRKALRTQSDARELWLVITSADTNLCIGCEDEDIAGRIAAAFPQNSTSIMHVKEVV